MILYQKKNDKVDIEIWIKKDKQGSLHIEGQDLSDSVSEVFGEDISEYEWSYIIHRKEFQKLINAIGIEENSDVLPTFVKRFSGENAMEIGTFLKDHDIQHQFWNRMGD